MQVLQRILDSGLFSFKGRSRETVLYFAGDLPWLKRLLGVSTSPGVMSVHSRGVYVSDKTGWVGEDRAGGYKKRTEKSDARALARYYANGKKRPLAECDGVTSAPTLRIRDRRRVCPCILSGVGFHALLVFFYPKHQPCIRTV